MDYWHLDVKEIENIKEMQADAMERLMNSRSVDGMWRGKLSSSAISTSVSVFALQRINAERLHSR